MVNQPFEENIDKWGFYLFSMFSVTNLARWKKNGFMAQTFLDNSITPSLEYWCSITHVMFNSTVWLKCVGQAIRTAFAYSMWLKLDFSIRFWWFGWLHVKWNQNSKVDMLLFFCLFVKWLGFCKFCKKKMRNVCFSSFLMNDALCGF